MAAQAFVHNAVGTTGVAEAGARLRGFVQGTTTPQTLYVNSGLSVAATFPYVADAAGHILVYYDDALDWTFQVKTANDASTLLEVDVVGGVVSITYADLGNFNSFQDAISDLVSVLGSADQTLAAIAALGLEDGKIIRGTGVDTGELIHFDDYTNVRDYGAVGDGVANDTAALQAAITAANSTTHKRLYFPAGTYKITAQLIFHSGVTWFGDGLDKSVIQVDATAGNIIPFRTNTTSGTKSVFDQTGIALYDLHFKGFDQVLTTTAGQIHSPLMRMWKVDGLTVQRCKFSGHRYIMLSLGGVKNFTITDSEFEDWGRTDDLASSGTLPANEGGSAIWCGANPTDDTPTTLGAMHRNWFHDSEWSCVYLLGQYLDFSFNRMENTKEGNYARATDIGADNESRNITYIGNHHKGVTKRLIQAAGFECGAKGIVINDNVFQGCVASGLDLSDTCEDATVTGNLFLDCATSGDFANYASITIRVTNVTGDALNGVIVAHNTIRSSAGNYGIRLYRVSGSDKFNNVRVVDNDLVGSAASVDDYLVYSASQIAADVVIQKNSGTADWRAGFVNVRDFGALGDGTTDDYAAINTAITVMTARGGGRIVFPVGTYLCNTGLTIPKNANLRLEGERIVTAAAVSADATYAGSVLKAGTGVVTLLTWNGDASVTVSQTELASGLHIDSMVLQGNGSTTTHLIDSLNSAFLTVDHCRLISSTNCIRATFNGTYTSLLLAGGMRISNCTFGPLTGGIGIEIDGHTQDWITRNWFAATDAAVQIKIDRSNKVNIVDNEFNSSATNEIFELNDAASEATQDIIIVGNKINCSGAALFDDNRTDASSRRIVFTGNSVIGPAAFDPSTLHNPATNIFAYSEDTTSKFYGNQATIGTGGLTVNGAVDINSAVSISGVLTMETTDIKRNVATSGLLIYGGTSATDGANLRFYGMTNGSFPGVFRAQFGGNTGGSDVGYFVLEGRDGANSVQEYFRADHTGLGWWGVTPVAQPTVTGSKGGNAALDSLLTALESYGLIVDSTT
jgi:hypothetical protein